MRGTALLEGPFFLGAAQLRSVRCAETNGFDHLTCNNSATSVLDARAYGRSLGWLRRLLRRRNLSHSGIDLRGIIIRIGLIFALLPRIAIERRAFLQ